MADFLIFHLNSLHMVKDLKIQLPLDLNGECLESVLCFWCECSRLLQVGTILDDRRERGTHLGQRVINPGLLRDVKNLGCFHVDGYI